MTDTLPPELSWLMIDKIAGSPESSAISTQNLTDILNNLLAGDDDLHNVNHVLTQLNDSMQDVSQVNDKAMRAWYRNAHPNKLQVAAVNESIRNTTRHIEDIASKASASEALVADMTKDIKSLDTAKRQITWSMTSLKRLQMLAVDQLENLVQAKNYKEIGAVLQAVLQLMTHFHDFKSIETIYQLSQNVEGFKKMLLDQIFADFNVCFNSDGALIAKDNNLYDACCVVEMVGDNSKQRLIKWYCDKQMIQYVHIFNPSSEAGQLDNISRRLAWLKRALRVYDDEHASLFPQAWKMDQHLACTFCSTTRDHFTMVLSRIKMDARELIVALHSVLDIETFLLSRFSDRNRLKISQVSQSDAPDFTALSRAFQPYLGIYMTFQDKTLAEMMETFKYDDIVKDDDAANLFPSSSALFLHYRQVFNEFERFSTGQPLLDLCGVFGKYLKSYANEVLLAKLKESKPSILLVVSAVLNTADYCLRTTVQLEDRAKAQIDTVLKANVSFERERETFTEVVATAVRSLVGVMESNWQAGFDAMTREPWTTMQTAGDSSAYVKALQKPMVETAGSIKEVVSNKRYARIFCDKVVENFAAKYVSNLSSCRPISPIAAEQMLLDLVALKSTLNTLLQITNEIDIPPTTYSRHVTRSIGKVEALLKLIMTQAEPADAFVQNFILLMGKDSTMNMQMVLDLKGLKRSEQTAILDMWKKEFGITKLATLPPTSDLQSSTSRPQQAGSGYLSLKPALTLPFASGGFFSRQHNTSSQ